MISLDILNFQRKKLIRLILTTFPPSSFSTDARESHYYPVSTAGINISSMLLEILNIGKGRQDKAVVGGVVTGGGGGRGGEEEDEYKIFPILFDHRRALEEMYCLFFLSFILLFIFIFLTFSPPFSSLPQASSSASSTECGTK